MSSPAVKNMKPRTKGRTYQKVDSVTLTQQQFKDECDINTILAKYQKTGAITHANNHSPEYSFATSLNFRESMEIVTRAQEMFSELPSSIRNKFRNNPEEFMDFVQNPENASEMAELGLTPKEAPPTPPTEVIVVSDETDTSTAEETP